MEEGGAAEAALVVASLSPGGARLEMDDDSKARRKAANKISAQRSREKKKNEIDQLKNEADELRHKVAQLEYQLAVAEGRPAPPLPAPYVAPVAAEAGEEEAYEEDAAPMQPAKKRRGKAGVA